MSSSDLLLGSQMRDGDTEEMVVVTLGLAEQMVLLTAAPSRLPDGGAVDL